MHVYFYTVCMILYITSCTTTYYRVAKKGAGKYIRYYILYRKVRVSIYDTIIHIVHVSMYDTTYYIEKCMYVYMRWGGFG